MRMMNKSISSSLVATAAALSCHSAVSGAIDVWIANNASVNVTNVGLNRWEVTIIQQVAGGSLVGLDSTNADDVIQRITVFHNSSFPTDFVTLTIRKNAADILPSSLAGVEEIDVLNPSATSLTLSTLVIDGSIGSASGQRTIEASIIGQIDIGGNWYADVIADNQASSSGGDITLAKAAGSMIGGLLINNEGDINLVDIGGSVAVSGGRTPEIWSSGTINEVKVVGNAAVRIGSNSSPGTFPGFRMSI